MLISVTNYDIKNSEAKMITKSNSYAASVIDKKKVSEHELVNKVKKNTNKPIYKTFYDDFDGDNSYEAFILVGTEDEYETDYLDGEVWLSNSKGAVLLKAGTFACCISSNTKEDKQIIAST